MKKFFIYASVFLLLAILTSCFVIFKSVVRIELPHGAVMHVLPAARLNRTHSAVILCPGGGYNYLEKRREGYMWFPFYYLQGYTVALLEYRLPDQDHQSPMNDGADAIRLMRKRATDWGYDSNKIGMMGFSAGGHLVSTMMVCDDASVRPDYAILFYPIISMKKDLTHYWAYLHLLGENPTEELENRYSNELHVSDQTPPAFIVVCSDDKIVDPENAKCFYRALKGKHRPVTFHEYPTGGHGWGYRLTFAHHRQMVSDLRKWLKDNNKKKE